MKKAIELHDSTLSSINTKNGQTTVWLNEAIIYHSEGEPGIDKATCFIQKIEIILMNSEQINTPSQMPVDISTGYFLINDKKYKNMIEIPNQFSGSIEIFMLTTNNEELKIQAEEMSILEHGTPEYLQEFE